MPLASMLRPTAALSRARYRLLVASDTAERHVLSARLLGDARSVVDVGGHKLLGSYARIPKLVSVNVDPPADVLIPRDDPTLPFEDGAFEASVSIDTLEHVPRPFRQGFIDELIRVASRRTVLCCPLGSPARNEAEVELNDWYRGLKGEDHPFVGEHIEHGPPTADELRAMFERPGHNVRLLFQGDFREANRQFRVSVENVHTGDLMRRARWVAFRAMNAGDFELRETPTAWSHRVFVVAERAKA
jgi:hypothetical protein